ncbi:AI-2E family transporter [Candidatus Rariloculus sp.]|uniref:AI-2E family transporter n=1 Tax=Candidatus Rariloculus sp. TaxID=3101265 RepID=UPI003D0D59CE
MLSNETIARTFFIALLFIVTAAFIWLIRGFLQPIFWAVALGIVVFPVHGKIEQRLGARKSLAAAASLMLVLVVVLLPLAGIIAAVTSEAAGLYARLADGDIDPSGIYRVIEQNVPQLLSLLQSVGIDPERLQAQLASGAVEVSRFIASRALAIGQDTMRVTVFFFLMIYLLFFFLRDGRRLLAGLIHALPFGDERERHLLGRFAEVSRATIKGTFVVGVVQGVIGGTLFALLGIGAPVLWGVVMALLSIIPAVGPALVWIPAAIVLIAGGQLVSGIVLIVAGVFVIGLVDNLLRPILVGRDTRMPDYLILLSTLGGLAGFGLSGVVIGPIIAAFFLSVWAMAAEEFGEAPELDAATGPDPSNDPDTGNDPNAGGNG